MIVLDGEHIVGFLCWGLSDLTDLLSFGFESTKTLANWPRFPHALHSLPFVGQSPVCGKIRCAIAELKDGVFCDFLCCQGAWISFVDVGFMGDTPFSTAAAFVLLRSCALVLVSRSFRLGLSRKTFLRKTSERLYLCFYYFIDVGELTCLGESS